MNTTESTETIETHFPETHEHLLPGTPFPYSRATALVTGASRGIGLEIARELARRGVAQLVLTARTASDLEALASEITTQHGTPVTVLTADLSLPSAAEQLTDELHTHGLHVDLLVNNAGFGAFGHFEDTDADRSQRMVNVNINSVVQLTHALLPAMVERSFGGILNVASTAAFQAVPFMATYGATKAFVLSFSEALWAENRKRGVRVVCLCPGGTKTSFDFGNAEMQNSFSSMPLSDASVVAKVGLDGLDRNANCVVEGALNKAGVALTRVIPRSTAAIITAALFRPKDKDGDKKRGLGQAIPVPILAAGLLVGGAVVVYGLRKRRG